MAEVLVDFDVPVVRAHQSYRARAVGRHGEDGMWEGWLEFIPLDGGSPLVGSVESRQPEHQHLVYWATGLTPIYLEGALDRALRPTTVHVRVVEPPASNEPAERLITRPVGPLGPEAVLDPFEIGGKSLDILRQELTALNRPRLLNIIAAYNLNPPGEDLSWMTEAQLVTFIVTATETQMLRGSY